MTTRAQLQEKSIAELREIAAAVGIETDGLQKSRLISRIRSPGRWRPTEAPPATSISWPPHSRSETTAATSPSPTPKGGATDDKADDEGRRDRWLGSAASPCWTPRVSEASADDDGSDDDDDDNRGNIRGAQAQPGLPAGLRSPGRGRARGPRGLLDILPEAAGSFAPRVTLPGDKDVYVSAGQIRKFGLRKGDMVKGPIQPCSKKIPAHPHRIRQRHGRRVRQELSPVRGPHAAVPDERLRLEVEGKEARHSPGSST